MSLSDRVRELVCACFSGIWIESHEHNDAIGELASLCGEEDWQLAIWDIDQGLHSFSGGELGAEATDPLAAIRSLRAMGGGDGTTLLVLKNFHRFLGSPEIVQAVCRAVIEGKSNRTFVVVLAPVVQLPVELEKLFVTVEHARPDRRQLEEIARGVATEEGEIADRCQAGVGA